MNDTPIAVTLHNALALFQAKEQELGRLDAAAGDGDHGQTMVRGLAAAVAAVATVVVAQCAARSTVRCHRCGHAPFVQRNRPISYTSAPRAASPQPQSGRGTVELIA